MASGFFALLDDIAALMDDVATMGKVATKKTAGILGDDLAVNAEKASGFVSSRELPVLWAISKGSLINKLIILPVAFVLSYYLPWAVTALLIIGGLYLAYEGAEKIYEFFMPHDDHHEHQVIEVTSKETILKLEKKKIRSAIITDFILSVEIVIIALGAVMKETITVQILVVSFVALLATVGVYGIVALIVRMDDFGLRLIKLSNGKKSFLHHMGNVLVKALPIVVKSLSVIGTLALLLVSGGIFVHKIDYFHHFLDFLPGILKDFIIGLLVGIVVLIVVISIKKIISSLKN